MKRHVARHASIDRATQHSLLRFAKLEEQSAQKVQSLLGYDELPSTGSVEKTPDKSRESIAQKPKPRPSLGGRGDAGPISAKSSPAAAAARPRQRRRRSRDHGVRPGPAAPLRTPRSERQPRPVWITRMSWFERPDHLAIETRASAREVRAPGAKTARRGSRGEGGGGPGAAQGSFYQASRF